MLCRNQLHDTAVTGRDADGRCTLCRRAKGNRAQQKYYTTAKGQLAHLRGQAQERGAT